MGYTKEYVRDLESALVTQIFKYERVLSQTGKQENKAYSQLELMGQEIERLKEENQLLKDNSMVLLERLGEYKRKSGRKISMLSRAVMQVAHNSPDREKILSDLKLILEGRDIQFTDGSYSTDVLV